MSRPLRFFRRATRRILRGRVTPWVVTERQEKPADPLSAFRLFAIVGTWMEADIIEATIRNAMTQGCERVYLIDNDSPDDTVARAEASGAILARTFTTTSWGHSVERTDIMNDVVDTVSREEGDEHVWWLFVDADEFPHGPFGLTIRAYLETLDRGIRIVGSRGFNHFPSSKPEYVSGFHPLDFQPLCHERVAPRCHWKHPLQRFDRDGPQIRCGSGFHRATCEVVPLVEAAVPLIEHHFQYRDEDVTRHRLRQLCTPDADGHVRVRDPDVDAVKRWNTLDALYDQRWADVDNPANPLRGTVGVSPQPWTEVVPAEHQAVARWYSADAVDAARRDATGRA